MDEAIKINSIPLVSWQVAASEIFEQLQPSQRFTICSARQRGKSTFVSQILLYVALNKPKSKSYYISPTISQSRLFFQAMSDMISGSRLVTNVNASLLEVTFINGSKIYFRSGEQKEHLRGATVTGILVIDEMNFLSEDIFPIILPFTTVHKANIIGISTPLFKRGTFYDWYIRGVNKEEGYISLNVNDYDNSFFITTEQINEYKKMLSPIKFKQEILGEFAELKEGLFGDYHKIFLKVEDEPTIVGIDWSNNGGDNTVISGFNDLKQQCMLEIVTNIKDPVDRAKKIAEIINQHPSIRKVVCETNSLGEVYISILKKNLNNPSILVNFTTTNESKKRIVEKLIAAIGQETITLLPHPQLDLELETYEMQELKNGNYTYNGKKDDCIMATCFALEYLMQNTVRYSFGFIKNK